MFFLGRVRVGGGFFWVGLGLGLSSENSKSLVVGVENKGMMFYPVL